MTDVSNFKTQCELFNHTYLTYVPNSFDETLSNVILLCDECGKNQVCIKQARFEKKLKEAVQCIPCARRIRKTERENEKNNATDVKRQEKDDENERRLQELTDVLSSHGFKVLSTADFRKTCVLKARCPKGHVTSKTWYHRDKFNDNGYSGCKECSSIKQSEIRKRKRVFNDDDKTESDVEEPPKLVADIVQQQQRLSPKWNKKTIVQNSIDITTNDIVSFANASWFFDRLCNLQTITTNDIIESLETIGIPDVEKITDNAVSVLNGEIVFVAIKEMDILITSKINDIRNVVQGRREFYIITFNAKHVSTFRHIDEFEKYYNVKL